MFCRGEQNQYSRAMKKLQLPNIPEFSDKNYKIIGYVVGGLTTLCGAFFIYEIFADGDLTFKAQWNMFKSPLGNLCLFIGFFWAILWWGKFTHWSATPVTEYRDSSGNLVKREENFDIMEQGFAKIIMPLLGHFIIEPIIYGAIIYYPIQCIIALVGSIFPYILALIVIGIIALAWMFTRQFSFRYHSVMLVAFALVFCTAFTWGGIAIKNAGPGAEIQMLADTQTDSDNEGTLTEDGSDDASPVDPEGDEIQDDGVIDEEDDQFGGEEEEGLFGCLPQGTTTFEGDMDGFPIEFNITKSEVDEIIAMFKNVNSGTVMRMTGESLPAMGGCIDFIGKDGNDEWDFYLCGDCDNVSGTATCGEKQLQVNLHKK